MPTLPELLSQSKWDIEAHLAPVFQEARVDGVLCPISVRNLENIWSKDLGLWRVF